MSDLIDRLVPFSEASRALGVAERTIRWWAQIGKITIHRKQRSVDSKGRGPDGRFTPGNRWGFKPGQSGNPKGRPPSSVEQIELLDRLTANGPDHYEAAGRILARGLKRSPFANIDLMELLTILRDELTGNGGGNS